MRPVSSLAGCSPANLPLDQNALDRGSFAGSDFQGQLQSGMSNVMDSPRNLAQPDSQRRALVHLLEMAANGDRSSLKSLYQRTSAKLYGICLGLLRDESEAQDVLQEVYLSLWRKAASFDATKASPITWMATIARNRAIDRLRSRRAPAEELDAATDVPDDAPSSFDILEAAEDASRLRGCLEGLEAKARNAIRSAFFDGATYPQLAAREGVPLPTMKSWIRRGLINLRGCLEA